MTIQSMLAWVTLLWLRSDNPNAKSHVSWTSAKQPNNPSNTFFSGDQAVYLKMGGGYLWPSNGNCMTPYIL
jgi:hypothetical protein